ncbi:MAG: type II toxin-antitoxin system VapC family toxin [Promethearchaeota archaeon]
MTTFFLDTNIIWWYIVQTSKYHRNTKSFLDPLILDPQNYFIMNEFVLIELFHHLIKKKGNQGLQLAKRLFGGNYPFFEIKFDILHLSDMDHILQILGQHGMKTALGGRDASIIHSMFRHNVSHMITHDKGFQNIKEITVHDPIIG